MIRSHRAFEVPESELATVGKGRSSSCRAQNAKKYVMSSEDEREGDHVRSDIPNGRALPLNSRTLVAEYIRAIASSMDLCTRALVDEMSDDRRATDGGRTRAAERASRDTGAHGRRYGE